MKPSITLLFTFILLIIQNYTVAQNKFEDACIVNSKNDTIKGTIDLKKINNTNGSVILIVNNKPEMFLLKQITSIIVKTKTQKLYYEPLIALLNLSSNDLANLNNSPLPKYKLSNERESKFLKDTVLAQVIVGGQKKLFRYIDNSIGNTHYLIKATDGNAIDLIYHRYYMDKGMSKIGYNEEYKSQLLNNLVGCNTVNFESINKIKFNETDLTKLFTLYNGCVNTMDSVYLFKNEKIKAYLGVVLGLNQSKLNFESDQSKINQTSLNKSISPNLGLYVNIVFPKANRSWSIYNELLFNQYKYVGTGYNLYYENPTWYSKINDVEIKASVIKLFTAIRYQLPKFKLKPFIQLGIGNGFAFSTYSKSTIETRFNSNINFVTDKFIEFRKHEQSLFSGIGLSYKKIGVELRYEVGNGMSQASGILSRTNYMYFLFNYRF